MAEIGLDVSAEFPKPLTDEVVRAADVVVTLGCGDACPVYPGKRYQDWPVADPAGQPLEVVRRIRYDIYHHVWELLETLVPGREPRPAATTFRGHELNRIAVITDIHGNLPALEASLDAIDAIGVDAVYCGGDLVGYGPHPNEVCRLIEERGIPTIYGNYDYAIARELDDCGCAYVTPARPRARAAIGRVDARAHRPAIQGLHARAAVRPALRARLARRSTSCTARRGRSTSTCSRTSPPACMSGCAGLRKPGRLCSATPTSPGSTPTAGVLFVNCGSVGKPKDGDPRAGFAILELDEAGDCGRRSSGSPTTPRRSPERSPRPACPASTPRSWSPPHEKEKDR